MSEPVSRSSAVQSVNRGSETLAAEDAPLCPDLAWAPRVLDNVAAALDQALVVGEERAKKLLYLVVTSRFDEPVSVVVKGPSAGGKSFLVGRVLSLFPPDASYALTAMSEKALAYSREPLQHRFLVLYEAAGLRSDFASYLIRSLLSEGRLRYETVERTAKGLQPRRIEREGPTGLITTTTAVRLHPENETRLLTVPVADTPAQTAAIMLAQASASPGLEVEPFHALQLWLAANVRPVLVPFAEVLAREIPPVAVRLRRDFRTVLALVRTHAFLHQATRPRGPAGDVVAALEDYATVRELIANLVADGVAASVSATTRETVGAVAELIAAGAPSVTVIAVARRLGLDESAAFRRVRTAISRGHLRNLEERARRPAQLVLGDPLPDDVVVLPTVERLQECIAATGDGSAQPFGGPPGEEQRI